MPSKKSKDDNLGLPDTSSLTLENWNIQKCLEAAWENNPRVIKASELMNLRSSIRKFGFIQPLVVNTKTGRLVSGHQRLKAAQIEGLQELPVALTSFDEQAEKQLNLALNKIEGKWDFELLSEIVTDLAASDAIEFTGFSELDLASLFSTQEQAPLESFEDSVARHKRVNTTPLIFFRSPDVTFSCLREQYEDFVHSLNKQYGMDDTIISRKFSELIGLDDAYASNDA